MRLQQLQRSTRSAFTLIELLVVMAIIAVLMGLLMSAVMAVMGARTRAQTRDEINKLDAALKVALAEHYKFGSAKTLPSKLVLANNIDVYRNPGSHGITATSNPNLVDVARSKEALRHMFGNKFITNASNVNWDGSGSATSVKVLEGQQCLVFYLGGMPVVSGTIVAMRGFSANPLDPTDGSSERIGPFFEFNSLRLNKAGDFYQYLDPYGTPYAYFGGTGAANNLISHCPSLPPSGVSAYIDATGKYANSNTFQIISAGKDKRFAPGGNTWDPARGSASNDARDDMSNFSSAVLAAPQQ